MRMRNPQPASYMIGDSQPAQPARLPNPVGLHSTFSHAIWKDLQRHKTTCAIFGVVGASSWSTGASGSPACAPVSGTFSLFLVPFVSPAVWQPSFRICRSLSSRVLSR